MAGVPYDQALANYRFAAAAGAADTVGPAPSAQDLLARHHPDRRAGATVALAVGANAGDPCQKKLAALLQSNAGIEEADLAGAPVVDTDVLVVGGGGAGIAAALTAAAAEARVVLATKLRLGDSNTVMAEGGIQAAVAAGDSPQRHFDDSFAAGHRVADRRLVAQMVLDGPDVIRWLCRLGMQLDMAGSDLATKRAGGASAARVLSYRDYTGLEMMRVLREALWFTAGVTVLEASPVVELLTDEHGECAGAVLHDLESGRHRLVRAQAVILATGGLGRLHLNGFPTSNHFGATADGLVLAYRAGARLRELDSFQYHPTGLAHPSNLAGSLVSEAARSAGARLRNGHGARFVDELLARDVVSAAIIGECAAGRGVATNAGAQGVWLDVPALERAEPGILEARFGGLLHLAKRCRLDPRTTPFLVYPTLHYQNGGVVIDVDGRSTVPGLFAVGEVAGGIHGRNRLMGNALLDILSFGRRAGQRAAEGLTAERHLKVGIEHVAGWQRALTTAGLPLDRRAPVLFPSYANFRPRAAAAGVG